MQVPGGSSIETERLSLVALTVDDADEMVDVLNDRRLHEFIGGEPSATVDELRDRYRHYVAGPNDPADVWLNWIVRFRPTSAAVGTVQATVSATPHKLSVADVAWVIGVAWQGRGFASEAARALVGRLRAQGVDDITAHIHPDHHASAAVARHAGLHPTDESHDGETVWRLGDGSTSARSCVVA